jgi:hypothetical protein
MNMVFSTHFVFIMMLVITFLAVSGGKFALMAYRLRPRHLVVRIVCGVVGLGLLAAMGWYTIRDTQECYSSDEARRSLTVQVPAKPAPALPKSFVDYKEGRTLIHFVFVDDTTKIPLVVYAKAFVVNWPKDKEKTFTDHFTAGTLKVKYNFSVDVMYPQPSNPPTLLTMGNVYLDWENYSSNSQKVINLHMAYCTGGYLTNLGYGEVMDKSPFSLVRFPVRRLQAQAFVTPLAQDDSLRAVNLDALGNLYKDKIVSGLRVHPGQQEDGAPYIPVALAMYLGASTVVLLAATTLLTQLFARQHLAFAGVMVLVLLYMAGLDRWMLHKNASVLEAPNAPVANRVLACRQMQQTFFYRHTAAKQLSALLEDKTTPPPLAEMARLIKPRLQDGYMP